MCHYEISDRADDAIRSGLTEPLWDQKFFGAACSGGLEKRKRAVHVIAHPAHAIGIGSQRLQEGPPDALRVVALHHHLAAPPWRVARKLPLSRRDDVLRALVAAGAELVIGGHVHQAGVAERREFKVLEEGPRRSLVLATSAALGRPRPERKEEARGLNVYDADAVTITVRTFSWDGTGFLQVGERQFSRR